ncbi:hypothetical protein [Haliscomenobacter sp.]|uniref:hypothetical protein n=1 Tax=Haliscomenobacter sp. TaxID=2717303 RepID=UPI00359418E6
MKIITTVGTSLIINSDVNCESLEIETFDESLFDGKAESNVKKLIISNEKELKDSIQNNSVCAELASLAKIDPEGKAEIHLLCTETITSYMCGRVLQMHLGKRAKLKWVKGLQVKNKKQFETIGLVELLNEMEKISQGDWGSISINMTGGYKAIIPFLTVVAQINQVPLYYIFNEEGSDGYPLIKMPQTPIDVNWSEFEKYNQVWESLRNGIDNWTVFKAQNKIEDDFHACVWFDDEKPGSDYALISGIGEAFYRRYKQWTFIHVLQNGPFVSNYTRRRNLNEAISGLQNKLNQFIQANGLVKSGRHEVVEQVRKSGGELDHTDSMKGTECLISKYPSANPEIRILYSFHLENGKVSMLKIWDFRIENFNHSTYPKELREFYEANKQGSWIPYLQTRNY